jgi:hypothetical protein
MTKILIKGYEAHDTTARFDISVLRPVWTGQQTVDQATLERNGLPWSDAWKHLVKLGFRGPLETTLRAAKTSPVEVEV